MRFTKEKFLIKSGGKNFDQDKIKLFLKDKTDEEQKFLLNIIDNTRYITFKEVVGALKDSMKKFSEEIGDEEFHIVMTSDKIGSEQWLTNIIAYEIKKLNFKGFISDVELKDGIFKNLLIIDDHVCSAQHLVGMLDDAFIHYKSYYKPSLYFVLGYAANSGLELINSMTKFIKLEKIMIFYSEVITQLSDIYSLEELDEWEGDEKSITRRFDIEGNPCLVYFDYTIGKNQSSFPYIYKKIISKDIDRSGIDGFRNELLKSKK